MKIEKKQLLKTLTLPMSKVRGFFLAATDVAGQSVSGSPY